MDNLLMDALLLRLAAAILGRPLSPGRLLAFSALGAAFSLCALLWPGAFASVPARAAVTAAMAFAFPWRGRRAYGEAFFAVAAAAFAVGGAALALTVALGGNAAQRSAVIAPVPLRAALITACAAASLPALVRKLRARRAYAQGKASLTVRVKGREYALAALRDSGCALTEPISGLPVIPAYLPHLASLARIPVPASLVGKRTVLYALRPEAVFVDGVPQEALLAPLIEPIAGAEALIPCQIAREAAAGE